MMDLSTREGRREQGKLVQQAAEAAGISLDELARAIECSRALIYQYVSGATLAQPDRLQLIARRTGQTLAHFYGGDATPEDVKAALAEVQRREDALAGAQEEFRRKRLGERLDALRELARAHAEPPDPRALVSACEQSITLARELESPGIEAEATLRLGTARLELCDLEAARRALQRAVELARAAGESDGEYAARQGLGHALMALGQVDDALAEFRAVADAPDWWHRWQGTLSLGAVYEQLGDYRAALAQFEQVESLLPEAPDEAAAAVARIYLAANLANVYLAGGDTAAAARLAEEALAGAEQTGNRDQYIEGHINLGVCAHIRGDLPGAAAALRRAGALARCTGDAGREAVATACLSRALAALGEFDRARELGKDAARQAVQVGSRRAELLAETALGEAHLGAGLARDALYHVQRALATARGMRLRREEAELLAARGGCERALGDAGGAGDSAAAALALARELGARPVEMEALLLAGRLALEGDDVAAAAERAREAEALAAAMDAQEALRRARTLRGAALLRRGDAAAAVEALRPAVDAIHRSRVRARGAGLDDTLLEDAERREAYLSLACALCGAGRVADAERLAAEVEWPPLEDALRQTIRSQT